MRIVFLGTPAPAAAILEDLLQSRHEVICVVTQPDRPRGRGQKLSFSPVKEIALRHNLPLEQPEAMKNNPVFTALLKSLQPDIGVVAAYGKILPKTILEIPRHGFINLHASLLPQYRGAAPVQWALLKGERETGVTIFKLAEALDAGPIIIQKSVRIEEADTAETLMKKIFEQGAPLLLKALSLIEGGKAKYVPQKETGASFAPSIAKESGEIDWKKSAPEILGRIRGLFPWPAAHTFCRGKRLKITRAKVMPLDITTESKLPGTVVHVLKADGFVVAAGKGEILITQVQPEGGKSMGAFAFALGRQLKIGEVLPS